MLRRDFVRGFPYEKCALIYDTFKFCCVVSCEEGAIDMLTLGVVDGLAYKLADSRGMLCAPDPVAFAMSPSSPRP